ncbi:MAG: anthranilate synthase/aminodeoxychorismate synthase-like glutamine amidotransferase [Myxococcota bacterium]|jgi:anthranilate synthase/aminodeoxychorismate synthase-like glutamine amidotransferase
MILMIDNYDSFTFNIVQYLGMLGADVRVQRNDEITTDQIEAMAPTAILISPGPCTPDKAGISVETVKRFSGRLPLLGVCLGHQSIAYAFGARIVRASRIMHGKTSPVAHQGTGIFKGLPSPFQATRYHSLVAAQDSIPECLEITARATDDGEIMGLQHREHPTWGMQFHPESILTTEGMNMLKNFLDLAAEGAS